MIQYAITNIDQAVSEILRFIADPEVYDKPDDGQEIENTLYQFVDELRSDLFVLIEYPYVDRVYRDSYYTYFASKHNAYFRDCIRVAFFSEKITERHFREEKFRSKLQETFRGFVIIRPTFPNVVGRSLLQRQALADRQFESCTYTTNVLINGVKLEVEGFPHSSQDAESISCAETTIWALMEYFGSRYPDYKPTLPSHILRVLSRYAKQRLLPSSGLTVNQISFALKEFGFGTYIYSADDAYGDDLENIIATYIESGIPIIAAIANHTVGHAIVMIGHETDQTADLTQQRSRTLTYADDTSVSYIDHTDIQRRYVIQDDNFPPYQQIRLANPSEHYEGIDDAFAGCTIQSIVVPLHRRVYLEADKAKSLVMNILTDADFGFVFSDTFVFRFFLTSSRSFKDHVARLPSLNADVKNLLVLSRMPKFIWCAELYDADRFAENQASGLIVIDATEASENMREALLFAGYSDRCLIRVGREFVSLPQSMDIYQTYQSNLR